MRAGGCLLIKQIHITNKSFARHIIGMRLWQKYLNADSNRNAQECQKAPRFRFLLIWRHQTLHRLQTCASVCSGRKQEMPVFLDIGILEGCKIHPPGVAQKKTRVFLSADPGLPASKPGFAHGQIWVFSQAKTADIDPKPPHRPAQG